MEIDFKDKLFVVAGMPRAGTTFLFHSLRSHPEVCLPIRKEVDYFSGNYHEGIDWYLSQYSHAEDGQFAGDISPSYFLDACFPDRLNSFSTSAKIIVGVRDPVDYAISFYRQRQTFDFNLPSFREFLGGYTGDFGGYAMSVNFRDNHVSRGIKNLADNFGDRILFFDFRVLEDDPVCLMSAVESFVGLTPYFCVDNLSTKAVNASGRKNSKFLTWLLSRKVIVAGAQRFVPTHLLEKAHTAFYQASSVKSKKSDIESGISEDGISEEDKLWASDKLQLERKKIAKIFEDSSFVTGEDIRL